ncbi:hypothetical protein CGRA01v4_05002 [Colletotrichum graminicola]|nr:hypothetical protein CGRA01v4_05002 [Colletotrichum graminicola]
MSLPSRHCRQAIPSLLFLSSFLPPSSPVRTCPQISTGKTNAQTGKPVRKRVQGRPADRPHVDMSHITHLLVRHNFCDVPLHPPPPRPRLSQLSHRPQAVNHQRRGQSPTLSTTERRALHLV